MEWEIGEIWKEDGVWRMGAGPDVRDNIPAALIRFINGCFMLTGTLQRVSLTIGN